MKNFLLAGLMLMSFSVAAQKATVVKLNEVLDVLEKKDEMIAVVNFWATWCGPCVAEMPMFEKLNGENRPDVKVTLVSLDLDMDRNVEKVHKFVARKKIASEVLILDEKDPNSYIDKIDPQWSGALPATIIVNRKTGKRIFVGKELKEGQLEELIEQVKDKS